MPRSRIFFGVALLLSGISHAHQQPLLASQVSFDDQRGFQSPTPGASFEFERNISRVAIIGAGPG